MTKHSTAQAEPEGLALSSACPLCVLYMGASHLPFWVSACFLFFPPTALGLGYCEQAFSGCGEQGSLFIVVCRLLSVVASLVVEHGL